MGCCFFSENKFEVNITQNIITHISNRDDKIKRAQKTNRSVNSVDDIQNFKQSKL